MKCTICRSDVPELDHQCKTHLLISKDVQGNIHTHGDLQAKENCKELLNAAAEEIGMPLAEAKDGLPAEVVFHNKQRIGDMLVFTCGVRDFKLAFPDVRVNVLATAMHIWDHNPHIDRSLVPTDKNTVKIGPGILTNSSNRKDWHFTNAYRVSIEEALKVKIPQGESRPDIYFTQEEYDAPRLFPQPYWIICTTGEKGWGCKMFPHERWQAFVDQNPDITFVQIGTAEDNAARLHGKNVIDHIGKTQSRETGIRDLFKLFLNAEGSIGLVSFHMHLSGALQKPCVVIAGAREPVHFTRYPGHSYLSTDGMLPCAVKACWHCALSACTNLVDPQGKAVEITKEDRSFKEPSPEFIRLNTQLRESGAMPKCVDMITPENVTQALWGYYRGGRLTVGVPSPKPLPSTKRGPINVVPTPPKAAIPFKDTLAHLAEPKGFKIPNMYGMAFGGGALTDKDWDFLYSIIQHFKVNSVLEFGAGFSTLLLNDHVNRVLTFETSQGWIDKITDFKPKADIRHWNGKDEPIIGFDVPEFFDMAFVDGPAGGASREMSTKLASQRAKIIVVHDAGREFEKQWQAKYLADGFIGPIKGGHRCHLWVDKSLNVSRETLPAAGQDVAKAPIVENRPYKPHQNQPLNANSGKFVKIVSTARGWGGCARSVTTIMRKLLEAGHRVEFIPFRNEVSSKEWKQALEGELKDVRVQMDYSTIREACDVLLMYADDYIWEFGKPEIEEAFSDIRAERKIMMLNYRRGKVGEIAWTKNWDKYMFLNSTQEDELLKVHPFAYGAGGTKTRTKVLPPCTDLTPFFEVKPDYNHSLRIVRHSSQGDTKFESPEIITKMTVDIRISRNGDADFSMLPGPSGISTCTWFRKQPRTADPKVIAAFLATGNLFWYSLPPGYMDMGPRVILEAMAAGLPVVADNWGGALDRVTPETGWICNTKDQHVQVIQTVTAAELCRKGEAARERAYSEFRIERWLEEILG